MKNSYATNLILASFFAFSFSENLLSQALPISIDSRFDDWTAEAILNEDASGDGTDLDFLRFFAANDEQFLFLRVELAQEIKLTTDNPVSIFLDTDYNSATGKSFNGIGAELEILPGFRVANFYVGSSYVEVSLNDIQFRSQPTVSGNVFEIALGRNVLPDGIHPLFTSNTINIAFQDRSSGAADRMPNINEYFVYHFDNSPTPPIELFSLEKESESHLRLLTWNTLADGLDDFSRKEHFKRVITAIQPDLVTFNECWDMTPGMVASFMNDAVPLGNFQSWQAVKLDYGNVSVSRFPILQNWLIYPNHRLTASLIDLPDDLYLTDFLLINAHLKCCGSDGDDEQRQEEADAFAKFILDAKSPGGVIDLPQGTPFVLSGDLNLVGLRQPQTTMLSGEIINTAQFGSGGALDWDATDLEDIISRHTDKRMAYTWRDDDGQYPPSRLDYHICSNSVMTVEKAFTLQTEVMSQERLDQFGLQQNDTHSASDHFPKVTDFSLSMETDISEKEVETIDFQVFPNPVGNEVVVAFSTLQTSEVYFTLQNLDGSLAKAWKKMLPAGSTSVVLDLSGLPKGVFILKVMNGNGAGKAVILKMKD